MSSSLPPEPPEVFAAVELPESEQGGRCEQWTGDVPTRCDGDATHVFVYGKSVRDDDDRRGNVRVCEDCCPEVTGGDADE